MTAPATPPAPDPAPLPAIIQLGMTGPTSGDNLARIEDAIARAAWETLATPGLSADVRQWIRDRTGSREAVRVEAEKAAPMLLVCPRLLPYAGDLRHVPLDELVLAVKEGLALWHDLTPPAPSP